MVFAGPVVPSRYRSRRQGHVERVQQKRHERVVPAERDELDRAGVAEELVDGLVGVRAEPAGLGELAGGR